MKEKPKPNMWNLILKIITVYKNKQCPRCKTKEPYYKDCPVCCAYVIGGGSSMTELDVIVKYIAWLNDENSN